MKLTNNFRIELSYKQNNFDLLMLRSFYTPLIKSNAINLYQYLSDTSKVDEDYFKGYQIKQITSHLYIDIVEFDNCRKLLEAMGLMKTYQNVQGNRYIFKLIKPLDPASFQKNPFFSRALKKAIGDVLYEQLLIKFKPVVIPKDDFLDISTKYVDLFKLKFDSDATKYTKDIDLKKVFNLKDAIINLPSNKFIEFLTGATPISIQKNMIFRLRENYLDKSINLLINHSYNVNDRSIIVNYIEKIANDMYYEKNIKVFDDIKVHIENALKSKSKNNYVISHETEETDQEKNEIINPFANLFKDI